MTRLAASLLIASSLLVAPACAHKSAPSGAYRDASPVATGAMDMAASPGVAMEDGGLAVTRSDDEPRDEGEYDATIQAGTLTAGAFDDTKNPAVLRAFANTMQQDPVTAALAQRLAAPVTVVQIVDAEGRPVSNARVHAGRDLVTRTDGRIVLTGLDIAQSQGDRIAVTIDHQGRRHTAQVRLGDPSATIELPVRAAAPVRALDVALVIDTTGSMGDELEYIKVEIRSIANTIARAFPDVEQRYALVVYRDQGDAYVARSFDFTADLSKLERQLGKQRADGGGDYPEAMHTALAETANLSWREGNVARVSFLVADAPPHAEDIGAAIAAADELRSIGVATYPVAASGVAQQAELVMRAAALMSGGQYIFLTDDSGVGDPHAEPHIPCYAVERLADVMTRMIRTELAGRRIEPDPRRTLRTVGAGQGGVCQSAQLNVAS